MKPLFKTALLLLVSVLTLAGCHDNATPKAGNQYTVLATPIKNAPPVLEVFSLACSHCRKMESIVPEIKKLIGSNIEQVHVTFNQSAQAAAMFYYTAAIQSDDHPSFKVMEELFSFIQDTPKTLTPEQREAKLNAIYHDNGMLSPEQLSEAQQKQVIDLMERSQTIVSEAKLDAVPAFIVQGKYLVNIGSANNVQDFANIIKYLMAKKS